MKEAEINSAKPTVMECSRETQRKRDIYTYLHTRTLTGRKTLRFLGRNDRNEMTSLLACFRSLKDPIVLRTTGPANPCIFLGRI